MLSQQYKSKATLLVVIRPHSLTLKQMQIKSKYKNKKINKEKSVALRIEEELVLLTLHFCTIWQ